MNIRTVKQDDIGTTRDNLRDHNVNYGK